MFGSLSFKLRVLAKQVSKDFMHFLGLDHPRESALSSTGIVSGLRQEGKVRQPGD